MDAKTIDPATFDLSVKNPNGGEAVVHRSPQEIMDEIAALDAESAEVLRNHPGAVVKIDPAFVDGIRELIAGAHATVARGVDLVQVHTNFEIGRRIVQEEQRGKDRAAYGKEVIKALADRLTGEFGKGFSLSNLKFMRLFYLQNQESNSPVND